MGERGGQSYRFHGRLQLVRGEEEVGDVDGLVAVRLNVKTNERCVTMTMMMARHED